MGLSRRDFLQMLSAGAVAGMIGCAHRKRLSATDDVYDFPAFGNVTLLHLSDCHAQLLPTYFREPSINLGVGNARNRPPHLVGDALLRYYGIAPGSPQAYLLTALDFEAAAQRYGKVGGFAHLATLVQRLRDQRPGRTLLLDSGDSWQGSATALWTRGQDMVDAQKLLGIEMMTAHWEFTLGAARVREILARDLKGHIEFLAQNVKDKVWSDPIFAPYAMRDVNGVPVAVIGQAFPYTPIANPRHLIPDWTFGIDEEHLQTTVDEARAQGAHIVVLLSHNGMDVDLKLASRVRGVDAILGGHTHDAVPVPFTVANAGGKTLVVNSGCNGKFLSLLDLDVRAGKLAAFRYRLLPVFANLLPPHPAMAAYIDRVRAPHRAKLEQPLAVTETLLYRRGNFNGTFDQLIVDALRAVLDAEIAFSPGFRWGTTLLPGDTITVERLLDQTAISYADAYVGHLTGDDIKTILEDVADNLYHPDPYYQQGGDMVRTGGMAYTLDISQPYGKRVSEVTIRGKPLDPSRRYKVGRWASVQPNRAAGRPVWEIVGDYLQDRKFITVEPSYLPVVKGIQGNLGWSR